MAYSPRHGLMHLCHCHGLFRLRLSRAVHGLDVHPLQPRQLGYQTPLQAVPAHRMAFAVLIFGINVLYTYVSLGGPDRHALRIFICGLVHCDYDLLLSAGGISPTSFGWTCHVLPFGVDGYQRGPTVRFLTPDGALTVGCIGGASSVFCIGAFKLGIDIDDPTCGDSLWRVYVGLDSSLSCGWLSGLSRYCGIDCFTSCAHLWDDGTRYASEDPQRYLVFGPCFGALRPGDRVSPIIAYALRPVYAGIDGFSDVFGTSLGHLWGDLCYRRALGNLQPFGF